MARKLNFRISGQKINIKHSAKYLGLVIDEWLKWKEHYDILRAKLERSTGLLAKLRYFVSQNLLRTVYFAIFDSYLRYGCQVWGQHNDSNNNEIAKLQDKAVRIISFKDRNTPYEPLYKDRKIIRFFDLVSYYNCLLAAEHLNQNWPKNTKCAKAISKLFTKVDTTMPTDLIITNEINEAFVSLKKTKVMMK